MMRGLLEKNWLGWLKRAVIRPCIASLSTGEADRANVVEEATDVLRVVQNVGCRRAELNPEAFGDRESLQGRDVDVVDRIELQSSTTYVRQSAVGSPG